jgi:plastocyanin
MKILVFGISMMLAAVRLEAATIEGTIVVRGARDSREVVVYVDKIPGKEFPAPAEPVTLDQRNLIFVPRVQAVLAGTKVAFPNSDDIRHNVFSPGPIEKFNLGSYPRDTTKYYVFDRPGPVTLLCNVHAEMSAYLFVTETPYFATTDSDGKFTINGVPPGKYVLKFWHERAKTGSIEIDVKDNQTTSVTFELKR